MCVRHRGCILQMSSNESNQMTAAWFKKYLFFAWALPFTLLDSDPHGSFPPSLPTRLWCPNAPPASRSTGSWRGPVVPKRTSSVLSCTTEPTALAPGSSDLPLPCSPTCQPHFFSDIVFGYEWNEYFPDCKSLIRCWLEICFFQELLTSGKGPKKCFWMYFFLSHLSFGIFKGLFLKWRTFLMGQMVQKF